MNEHRVKCDICKELFRPNPSKVRLICYGCSREGKRNQIQDFLKSWDYMMERIEFHTENPDSELMDEVSEEYKKWEAKKESLGQIS